MNGDIQKIKYVEYIDKTIDDAVYIYCSLCILYRGLCYLECNIINDDLKTELK